MKRILLSSLVLILVIAMSLSACGGGGSGGGGGSSTGGGGGSSSSSSSTPSGGGSSANSDLDWDNPIYLGFALVMSTEGGQHYMWGMDKACENLNEAGGFDGRPFVMIYENAGEADQQSYINALMKLLDRYDDMSAIVADINTPYVLATIGNIETAGGVAYVSGASSRTNAESGSEWVFITRTVDIYSAANMCHYVMSEGADTIGILRMSDASGTSWTERFIEVLDNSYNKAPAAHEVFDERTETNFTPYVLKAIAAGCDTIVSKSGVVNEQVINSVYDNGFEGLKFDPDISTTHLRNCGEKIEGWASTSDFNDQWGVNKPMLAVYNEQFFEEFDMPTVRAAAQYHDIVLLLAEAMRIAGTADDKTAIRDALYEIKNFEGMMTHYTYHEVGRTFPDYQYKLIVEDGNFKIVDRLMTYEVNQIYIYPEGQEPANYVRARDKDRPA